MIPFMWYAQKQLTYSTRKWLRLPETGVRARDGVGRDPRELSGEMHLFYISNVVGLKLVYEFVPMHHTWHLKWMHLVVCNVYLNDADVRREGGGPSSDEWAFRTGAPVRDRTHLWEMPGGDGQWAARPHICYSVVQGWRLSQSLAGTVHSLLGWMLLLRPNSVQWLLPWTRNLSWESS